MNAKKNWRRRRGGGSEAGYRKTKMLLWLVSIIVNSPDLQYTTHHVQMLMLFNTCFWGLFNTWCQKCIHLSHYHQIHSLQTTSVMMVESGKDKTKNKDFQSAQSRS